MIPPALERGVLALVRDGGGRASWHWLETRVPLAGLPLDPDALTVLKHLQARGLVTREIVPGGMDRWAITPAGEAMLAAPARAAGPDQPGELLAALRQNIVVAMPVLLRRAADPLALWGELRDAVAADPSVAVNAALGSMVLGHAECGAFLRELLADPRPEIRGAVFDAFAPPDTDTPGTAVRGVADDRLDDMLRAGLLDPAPSVRALAARLAFAAERGESVLGELMVNLEAPERDLRWWAVLALGAARDALSLDHLSQLAAGDDLMLAGAAVRALAARPDGRRTWFAALSDPRPGIGEAATFALERVASGLDPTDLNRLDRDPRPEVQNALAAYRARSA